MFQGATALTVDAKGRIAIPARHRDALAPNGAALVLTAHPHRCLMVYAESTWEPIRARLIDTPGLDPRAARLRRMLVGMAQSETLDGSGRVLISPALRQWAGLEKQTWLIGQGRHFELWSDQGWQEQLQIMLEETPREGLPPDFENMVL